MQLKINVGPPLFKEVPKREFDAFLSFHPGTYKDAGKYHVPVRQKFHRSMVAYEEGGKFFILNDLGEMTLFEPLPLMGDE